MTPVTWPAPRPQGDHTQELALVCDAGRPQRLLIVPALFDAANRMRRFTAEVMRRLDGAGIDCFLPDLPGCNESLAPLAEQTPTSWRSAMAAAAGHFSATHVLAIHGGALFAPAHLPGWLYAPASGASLLRQMLRTRIFAAREAGRTETQPQLLELAQTEGLDLAGYRLSPAFLAEFEPLAAANPDQRVITQDQLGGAGLWLRAEPGESREQADALAAIIAVSLATAP